MSISLFFFRFFPLFIVIVFLKGFMNSLFPIWYGDIYLAFALACINYFKFDFITGIAVFIIGIMRSFDGYYPLLFFPVLYVFIFWLKEVSNKYFKEESAYFHYTFWLSSIVFVLIILLFIYFKRLNLYSITYGFIFWILVKSLIWIGLTFLLSYIFFRFLKFVFDEHKDK